MPIDEKLAADDVRCPAELGPPEVVRQDDGIDAGSSIIRLVDDAAQSWANAEDPAFLQSRKNAIFPAFLRSVFAAADWYNTRYRFMVIAGG